MYKDCFKKLKYKIDFSEIGWKKNEKKKSLNIGQARRMVQDKWMVGVYEGEWLRSSPGMILEIDRNKDRDYYYYNY